MDTELTDQRRQQTAPLWAVAAGAVWTFTFILCEMVSSAPMFHAGDAEAPLIALFGASAGSLFLLIAAVTLAADRRRVR